MGNQYKIGDDDVIYMLEKREVVVKRVSSQQSKSMRREFDGDAKAKFREVAYETTARRFNLAGSTRIELKKQIRDMEIHHQIPLWLGGDNSEANLVLVPPSIHKRIHRYINGEAWNIQEGEERVIRVPYIRHPLFWRLQV